MRIEKATVEAICNIDPRTFQKWRKRSPRGIALEQYPGKYKKTIAFEVPNLLEWFRSEGYLICAERVEKFIKNKETHNL